MKRQGGFARPPAVHNEIGEQPGIVFTLQLHGVTTNNMGFKSTRIKACIVF